ncbi:MAG: AbrB/MazE/SpoVT family DNA-binding domain-containing protein [Zestosphaera sp.]
MSEKVVKKVSVVGKGSLSVIIPKKWAESIGIKPGDDVNLVFDGSRITMLPRTQRESDESMNILVEVESQDLALRKLVSAYLEGVTKVKVKSSYVDVIELAEKLKSNVTMFILKADPSSDVHEFVFNDVKAELDSIAKLMESTIYEVLEALEEGALERASLAYKEVMRMYLYFLRNLKLHLAEESIEPYEAIDLVLAVEYVKELLDVLMSMNPQEARSDKCVGNLLELTEASTRALFSQDIDSAVNTAGNVLKALATINAAQGLCDRCRHLLTKISEIVLGRCIRNKACRCKHFYPRV